MPANRVPRFEAGSFAPAEEWEDRVGQYTTRLRGEPWVVTCDVAIRSGKVVIQSLRVSTDAPANSELRGVAPMVEAEVTQTVLRKIDFPELRRAIALKIPQTTAIAAELADMGKPIPTSTVRRIERAASDLSGAKLRRGRQGYPDEFFQWVALRYLELTAPGSTERLHDAETKRPVPLLRQLLAEGFDRLGREMPPGSPPIETARSWLRKAKAKGFIQFNRAGERGGTPGPNLAPTTPQKRSSQGRKS